MLAECCVMQVCWVDEQLKASFVFFLQSCQICCCDDNEAELLLCDICDRGYHTYCVKVSLLFTVWYL